MEMKPPFFTFLINSLDILIYIHLGVFVVFLPHSERTKLTAQSLRCAFLGYAMDWKGACVFCISWNVVFFENQYFFQSYWDIASSSISFLVFPTITRFNPVYVYKRRRLEREPSQGAPSDVTIPTLVPPNTPPDTPPVAPLEAPLHRPTRPSKPPDQFGLTHRLYLTIFHLLRFLTLTHR